MLDKISIISSKIKRNCLSLVIASVIISIIFGKSIAREVEFLLVIDMLISVSYTHLTLPTKLEV